MSKIKYEREANIDIFVVYKMDQITGLYDACLVFVKPKWNMFRELVKSIPMIRIDHFILCQLYPIATYHSFEEFDNAINFNL